MGNVCVQALCNAQADASCCSHLPPRSNLQDSIPDPIQRYLAEVKEILMQVWKSVCMLALHG